MIIDGGMVDDMMAKDGRMVVKDDMTVIGDRKADDIWMVEDGRMIEDGSMVEYGKMKKDGEMVGWQKMVG
jgi:hypothetical protein